MLICVAKLLRDVVAAIDMTEFGKDFTKLVQDLRKDIPEINTGKIEEDRKAEVLTKITDAYRDLIKKYKGHGLSAEKAAEMYTAIKDMQVKGDFKHLIMYPYNFALAWKNKVIPVHTAATFSDVRKNILNFLKKEGWTINEGLKIPYAVSPQRDVKLWFKSQSVQGVSGQGVERNPYESAHSWTSDIRNYEDPKKFMELIERWKNP